MNLRFFILLLLIVSSCSKTQSNKEKEAEQQHPPVKCMENSPERRGEEGCTILENRPLSRSITNELFWHLDRFNSEETAMKAAGPNGVAAEAHGSFWLMTVENKTEDHHGGSHVALLGPLNLPAEVRRYMRVNSSLLYPGSVTPIHTHSGPEVFYIVDGEQCVETPERGYHLSVGQSFIVSAYGVHRGRVIGSKPRRALSLVLYDSAHASSHDLEDPPVLVPCK